MNFLTNKKFMQTSKYLKEEGRWGMGNLECIYTYKTARPSTHLNLPLYNMSEVTDKYITQLLAAVQLKTVAT